jgi:hypothetical protein
MPGAQVGLGLLGVTGLGAVLAGVVAAGAAMPVESALAVVFVAVSVVVWLLLQAASKPRAAIGAAQRAVPSEKWRICTEVVIKI